MIHSNLGCVLIKRLATTSTSCDIENAIEHSLQSVLTSPEGDSRLMPRMKRLRTLLSFVNTIQHAQNEEEKTSLQVCQLYRLILIIIKCSIFFNGLASECFRRKKYTNSVLVYEIGIELNPRNTKVKCTDDIVHISVICDACSESIKGTHFKCRICEDYDLCRSCYQRCSDLHSLHREFLNIPGNSWSMPK